MPSISFYLIEHIACQPKILTRNFVNSGSYHIGDLKALILDPCKIEKLRNRCWNFSNFFTNDLSACVGSQKKPLSPGRCVYGAFLTEQGTVVDDTIIFELAENNYLVMVNAGMGATVAQHLTAYIGSDDVDLIDLTDRIGKVDLQGPKSGKIMKKLLFKADDVLKDMPYFTFKGHLQSNSSSFDTVQLTDGTPILLSRTGYTGEFGFEIFVDPIHLVNVWEMLLKSGEEFGLIPSGLLPEIPSEPAPCSLCPTRISVPGLSSTIPGILPCRLMTIKPTSPNHLSEIRASSTLPTRNTLIPLPVTMFAKYVLQTSRWCSIRMKMSLGRY